MLRALQDHMLWNICISHQCHFSIYKTFNSTGFCYFFWQRLHNSIFSLVLFNFCSGFILKETSQTKLTKHDNQCWKAYDRHQNKKCLQSNTIFFTLGKEFKQATPHDCTIEVKMKHFHWIAHIARKLRKDMQLISKNICKTQMLSEKNTEMEINIPYRAADMTKDFIKTIRGIFSALDSWKLRRSSGQISVFPMSFNFTQ